MSDDREDYRKHLNSVCNDLADTTYRNVLEAINKDGFSSKRDEAYISSGTLGAMLTAHLLTLHSAHGKDLAKAHRDLLITHLNNASKWIDL